MSKVICGQRQYGDFRKGRRGGRLTVAVLVAAGLFTSGCDPVALTMIGVGASAGVQHTLNGISYRTFTAPLPQVHTAIMSALNRMGISKTSSKKSTDGETITAKAGERDIEIQLDAITPRTTRMRSIVRNGALMDSATGTEIILQTERIIGNG